MINESTGAEHCDGCGDELPRFCRKLRAPSVVLCSGCGSEVIRYQVMRGAEERAARVTTEPCPPPAESGVVELPRPALSPSPRTLGAYSSAARRWLAGEAI